LSKCRNIATQIVTRNNVDEPGRKVMKRTEIIDKKIAQIKKINEQYEKEKNNIVESLKQELEESRKTALSCIRDKELEQELIENEKLGNYYAVVSFITGEYRLGAPWLKREDAVAVCPYLEKSRIKDLLENMYDDDKMPYQVKRSKNTERWEQLSNYIWEKELELPAKDSFASEDYKTMYKIVSDCGEEEVEAERIPGLFYPFLQLVRGGSDWQIEQQKEIYKIVFGVYCEYNLLDKRKEATGKTKIFWDMIFMYISCFRDIIDIDTDIIDPKIWKKELHYLKKIVLQILELNDKERCNDRGLEMPKDLSNQKFREILYYLAQNLWDICEGEEEREMAEDFLIATYWEMPQEYVLKFKFGIRLQDYMLTCKDLSKFDMFHAMYNRTIPIRAAMQKGEVVYDSKSYYHLLIVEMEKKLELEKHREKLYEGTLKKTVEDLNKMREKIEDDNKRLLNQLDMEKAESVAAYEQLELKYDKEIEDILDLLTSQILRMSDGSLIQSVQNKITDNEKCFLNNYLGIENIDLLDRIEDQAVQDNVKLQLRSGLIYFEKMKTYQEIDYAGNIVQMIRCLEVVLTYIYNKLSLPDEIEPNQYNPKGCYYDLNRVKKETLTMGNLAHLFIRKNDKMFSSKSQSSYIIEYGADVIDLSQINVKENPNWSNLSITIEENKKSKSESKSVTFEGTDSLVDISDKIGKALLYVIDSYRNKSAHTGQVQTCTDAEECRKIIMETECLLWILLTILK